MVEIVRVNTSHLSDSLAAPDRLDGLYWFLSREAEAIRQPSLTPAQHHEQLLLGTASPIGLIGSVDRIGFEFPDASHVGRSVEAVSDYLNRLLAPNALSEARKPICDYLNIIEPEETAEWVADLALRYPNAITSLLSFRLGRAYDLLKVAANACRGADSSLDNYEELIEEFGRIWIAYCLRRFAEDCARQIHKPTGWAVLDQLQTAAGSSGTVHVGEVVSVLKAEIAKLEKVLDLYLLSTPRPIAKGVLARNPLTGMPPLAIEWRRLVTIHQSDSSFLYSLGLEGRARVQLALWEREHGDQFEPLLQAVITEIRAEIAEIKQRLSRFSKQSHHNQVLGNLDKTPAAVRLHLAVETAVAWTSELSSPASTGNSFTKRLLGGGNNPIAALTRNITDLRNGSSHFPPIVSKPEHASAIAYLFHIYRFAFLRDDEMVPTQLRTKIDPTTGKTESAKRPDDVARLHNKSMDFETLWIAFENQQHTRINAANEKIHNAEHTCKGRGQDQSSTQAPMSRKAKTDLRSQARIIDYETRRHIASLRSVKSAIVAFDMRQSTDLISNSIINAVRAK